MLQDIAPTCSHADCYFLENFNEQEVSSSIAHKLGTVIYWKNYRDAVQLLKVIQPDKLIFQLIDNYYHFALFFAARHLLKIPIWYMDHGIKYEHGMINMDMIESGMRSSLIRRIIGRKVKSYVALLKNSFFRKTKEQLTSKLMQDIQQVFNSRSKNSFAVFMKECGNFIQPDRFIAYSPETFAFHKIFFSLPKSYESQNRVHFVGIPSLDNLCWIKSFEPAASVESFLLIDQCLHEHSLMGWTEGNKIKFIINLVETLQKFNLKLKIKPHPWNASYYDKLPVLIRQQVIILKNINPKSIEDVNMVGSFNSTLLLPFCTSFKFKVFCFEMNPQVVVPSFSYGIIKFEIAQEIKNFEELKCYLTEVKTDSSIFEIEKIENFTRYMLYKFDGLSSKRLNDAILAEIS